MKTRYRPFFAFLMLLIITLSGLPVTAQPRVAASNQPAQISFFGMNTYFTGLERIRYDGEDGIAHLIGQGQQIGVAWAREELSWGNLERNGKGRWEWTYFDRRLLQAAQAGYGIIGMLLTTPAWARPADCAARVRRYAAFGVQTQEYWCPPARSQDYADYVAAVVERYDGDGFNDAPGSPRIAAWQIWNEPNHWETWPGSPAEYAALLRAGYAAAKAADPSAIVATGGVYVFDGSWSDGIGHNDGLHFLDAVLSADPAAWYAFDVLAIHPFMPDVAPDQPGILGKVSYVGRIGSARAWLAKQARRYGSALRQLWISEVGWSTCTAGEQDCYAAQAKAAPADGATISDWRLTRGAGGFPPPADETDMPETADDPAAQGSLQGFIGKTEEQQANYMVRAHALALALGVQHMSYFQLEDKFDGTARNFWEEAGLLRPKSVGYLPRLAFGAYNVMSRQLANVVFRGTGPLHTSSNDPEAPLPTARTHLRFQTFDNVLIDVLWRNSGSEELSITLEPGRSAELVMRDGVRRQLSAQGGAVRVTVSEQPLYLRQTAPPALVVTPTTLTVLVQAGAGSQAYSVSVGNRGSGLISWSAASDATWLTPNPASGRSAGEALTVTINPAGLSSGTYNATLSISSDAGTQRIPVRLLLVPQVWQQHLPIVAR